MSQITKINLMIAISMLIYLIKFVAIFQDSLNQHPIFLANLILDSMINIHLHLILDYLLGHHKYVQNVMDLLYVVIEIN